MAALSIGARGPRIVALQKRLHELGYSGVVVDGVFGPATQSAVADLQERHGLHVDGEVDARLAALIGTPLVVPAPGQPPESIDEGEAIAQWRHIARTLEAPDEATRRTAAAEGFMSYGLRFLHLLGYAVTQAGASAPKQVLENAAEVVDQVGWWFNDWLRGERFTERLDEAERRAIVAKAVLDERGLASLARLAINGVLALPESHPQRDVAWARSRLLAHLGRCEILGDDQGAMQTIQDIMRHGLLPPRQTEQLIKRGERVLPRIDDPAVRRNFWANVAGFHSVQAFAERERLDAKSAWFKVEGEPDNPPSRSRLKRSRALAEAAMNSMEELLEVIPEADRARVRAKNRASLAMLYGLDEPAKSVEFLKEALDSETLEDEFALDLARMEAKQRLLLDQWERACELIEPRIDAFEHRYLAAVDEAEIKRCGEEYSEALTTLAWACVAGDRWNLAVQALGRGRGVRLRHRAALRRSPAGRIVLERERRLHAIERGVQPSAGQPAVPRDQDWVGISVSDHTAALEAYRVARREATAELVHPDTAAIGAALQVGEAVALLGVSYRGLLMAVVCAGDSVPSGRFCLSDWTEQRIVKVLVGRGLDGWVMALGGRIDPDPELQGPLERALRAFDRIVGQSLGAFAHSNRIEHLTIVPDPWLDFIPWWALKSLSGLDVSVASSLEQFTGEQKRERVAVRRALVVSDPTGDLAAAMAEGEATATRLAAAGVKVERLNRTEATRDAVVDALQQCEWLHFAGHGRSALSEPLRSALALHPDWARAPVSDAEALTGLFARKDIEWQQPYDEVREATVESIGQLRELRTGPQFEVERWLDYAEGRTLWSLGEAGEFTADLWSAGAMAVGAPLDRTRVCFLSACSSGGASTPSNEGASGLVAALQLSGASTVISTRWEIVDAVGLLVADLFYERLIASNGEWSVTRVLRGAVTRLRQLTQKQTARRLGPLIASCSDEDARAQLEESARLIETLGRRPFSHPYFWGAYHVSGSGTLRLRMSGQGR
jgi:CHAT domain-containing protein/tetratricopeptide (TPR) repeat protein